jgi:hypothetical protein
MLSDTVIIHGHRRRLLLLGHVEDYPTCIDTGDAMAGKFELFANLGLGLKHAFV